MEVANFCETPVRTVSTVTGYRRHIAEESALYVDVVITSKLTQKKCLLHSNYGTTLLHNLSFVTIDHCKSRKAKHYNTY